MGSKYRPYAVGFFLLFAACVPICAPSQGWLKFQEKWSLEANLGENDYHFTLQHDGLTRHYNVHLPPGYDAHIPMPVVIYLHGGGGSITGAYRDKLDQFADKDGFILVIPNGTGPIPNHLLVWNVGSWDNNGCCGYAYEHKVDDVGFISSMIDDIKIKFAVDDKRVYATGISNGALLSYLLGCQLPGKIAAAAPIAPPGIPDGCISSGPVSLLHVHGTGDTFAKYNGGKGGSLIAGSKGVCFDFDNDNNRTTCRVEPAEQQAAYWIKKNQCTHSKTVYQNGAATCTRYGGCANATEFEFCKIQGGGHTWPSGYQYAPVSKVGPVSNDISFDQIWDFLKDHSLDKDQHGK